MRYEFVELVESLVTPEEKIAGTPASVLVITKAGKFLRGHISDHNVRINSDGRVRGRIVLVVEGAVKRDVEASDISSLEKIKS